MSRVAVVTGVSRAAGLGAAIATRLRDDGLDVLSHGWPAHDAAQPWAADPHERREAHHLESDLADPAAPACLVAAAVETFGGVDVLVANHAHSSPASRLADLTAEELDRAWAVNARATLLLVQAFAARHDDARAHGRVVLLSSGQHLAPMPDELPYVASKGAVHQLTRSLAAEFAGRGITVNALNPGPVDTGWATDADLHAAVATRFPAGRWPTPHELAPVVAWLASPESAPVTGQVLDAESGFRRD